MEVFASLTGVALSLVGVGVLGLFGRGSDDTDLSAVARRLDAREDPDAIVRKLDALDESLDALVADADADRHLRDPPAADASSVEKAAALAKAVERGQLSVGPASGGSGSDAGVVTSAAARVRRERSPTSPEAQQLLDAATEPDRAESGETTDALEAAVAALDTRKALERALDGVPDGDLSPGDARRIRNRLDRTDGVVASGVRRLAETAEKDGSAAEHWESERERIADATDDLVAAAADAADLTISPDGGRSVAERLCILADAVNRNELEFAEDGDGGRVPEVVGEVRRSRSPESTVAKRLLDRLAAPELGDLRAALDAAVEQLDVATTTQSIVADLDRESVRDLADDVEAELDETAGPVADALADRVADLRGMVDRADDSNAVIPYAVRNELRFYDRTLLGAVGDASQSASADGIAGAESPDAALSRLAERRADIEDRYVDGRRDHNHSIPLHFLSLADALRDDAERAAANGGDRRAAGLLAAADETLAHVEQLYERNEYSVMLRRLRG